MINKTSAWSESYPEFYTNGKCHTYDPEFESPSGFTFAIGMGLRLAGEKEYDDFAVFLHEKGYVSSLTLTLRKIVLIVSSF